MKKYRSFWFLNAGIIFGQCIRILPVWACAAIGGVLGFLSIAPLLKKRSDGESRE